MNTATAALANIDTQTVIDPTGTVHIVPVDVLDGKPIVKSNITTGGTTKSVATATDSIKIPSITDNLKNYVENTTDVSVPRVEVEDRKVVAKVDSETDKADVVVPTVAENVEKAAKSATIVHDSAIAAGVSESVATDASTTTFASTIAALADTDAKKASEESVKSGATGEVASAAADAKKAEYVQASKASLIVRTKGDDESVASTVSIVKKSIDEVSSPPASLVASRKDMSNVVGATEPVEPVTEKPEAEKPAPKVVNSALGGTVTTVTDSTADKDDSPPQKILGDKTET